MATYFWSTMTAGDAAAFTEADDIWFDVPGGATEALVDPQTGVTVITFAGVTFTFNNATLAGRIGQLSFQDGSVLVLDSTSLGAANTGVLTAFGDMALAGGGDDNLSGLDGRDTLDGGAGADTIDGGGDDDEIAGGLGDDVLDGGDGYDHLTYAAATGGVIVDLSQGMASGAAGQDEVANFERVTGSDEDDTLVGDVDNWLDGAGGDDSLVAGSGYSVLVGGDGNDTLDGSNGVARADYSAATSAVVVDLAAGVATGGAGSDSLIHVLDVAGSGFDDSILGCGCDNVIDGAAGDDTIDGGGGMDLVTYESALTGVSVDLDAGVSSGGGGADSLLNISNVAGSYYDDTLIGDDQNNMLDGDEGDDELQGMDGDDVLVGADGDDSLAGGDDNDLLDGGEGSDTLDGGGGDDLIVGGAGDELAGGQGDDTFVLGEDGVVSIDGGAGQDAVAILDTVTLSDVKGVEIFLVGGADVSLDLSTNDVAVRVIGVGGARLTATGTDFNDSLIGSLDDDTLSGGDGDDLVEIISGSDKVDGGSGVDTVSYESAFDGVVVDLGEESASHDGDVDTLVGFENVLGSDYDDDITGDAGANSLAGRWGDDTLSGSAGQDSLSGGAGDDLLVDQGSGSLLLGGAGYDVVEVDRSGAGGAITATVRAASATLSDGTVVKGGESIQLTGTAANDILKLSLLRGDHSFDGGGGVNTVQLDLRTSSGAVYSGAGAQASVSDAAGSLSLSNVQKVTVVAGAGADSLMGGDTADRFRGGRGDDTVGGGSGRDNLTGGAGADSFVFRSGDGTDKVGDFSAGDGDRVVLDAGTTYQVRETANGAAVLILDGSHDKIILLHTDSSTHEDWVTYV